MYLSIYQKLNFLVVSSGRASDAHRSGSNRNGVARGRHFASAASMRRPPFHIVVMHLCGQHSFEVRLTPRIQLRISLI